MSCAGLASDLSSAAQAVSTADPAKIIDSAKHFALDPFADIANHAASGDWNGAGVASGHVAVAVVQVALAVSGICEAVMADSCFLPSIADMMDLVDATRAVTGAETVTTDATTITTEDLYNFGNSQAPALRVDPAGTTPAGVSTWTDPQVSGLHGYPWQLPSGTELPEGFGLTNDEPIVPGHRTITPPEGADPVDVQSQLRPLPWVRGLKIK
jgi:hypothetical protein